MNKLPVGQQVMVVFGASSGIGRVVALAAAHQGAHVVAAGRDALALDTLVTEGRGRIVTQMADAVDVDQVEAIADLTVSRHGRMDSWIHVAGTAEYATFDDMLPSEFRRVVEVDLLGPVWGARAALPHLRATRGSLVVVSSEIAKRAFPLLTSYSAAKHGVDGFLSALRLELQQERSGVSVTQIMPGAVDTPFFEHARTRLGVRPSGPPPVASPEKVAKAILHAAEHGGRDVPVGVMARLQLGMQRISPRAMDAVARTAGYRMQKSKEAKSAGSDALFDPPVGDDRTTGVVSNLHR